MLIYYDKLKKVTFCFALFCFLTLLSKSEDSPLAMALENDQEVIAVEPETSLSTSYLYSQHSLKSLCQAEVQLERIKGLSAFCLSLTGQCLLPGI